MDEGITETIGCDLGDKTAELFVLQPDGRGMRPKPVRMNREAVTAFFKGRPKAHVVMEVGTHSRWVSTTVAELGHQVTIANPRQLALISQSDRKSDRKDAELLARLGRADPKLLSPVVHRGHEAQADLAVAKARDVLVECRTKLVNHVRGITKSFGLSLPRCEAEAFHRRTKDQVPPELKPALAPIYEALGALEESIRVHEKRLEQLAKKYPDVAVVSQPAGVGILTALVFLLSLEDKARFENSRAVGAFVGLTPRKDQSGNSDKQLRITKAGDPFMRRLLVNSANYILGPFGPDSDLRRFGLRLAERGGKNAKKRAKVAVARKLTTLMHRLWVTGEVYEPLRNTHQREKALKPAA
jgi:transposase